MAAAPVGGGKITRDLVLATELEIIDRDGAEALPIRRLAAALDRDPMIIYRHAPNKAPLLDGVAETVLGQLKVDSADPDWATQLRAVTRDYRRLALADPHVGLVFACSAPGRGQERGALAAAVQGQARAADVGRPGGRQEKARVGHVVRGSHPA